MITSWARGPAAPANPWRALTLEWQVSSPPPVFNFDEIPQVVGNPYEYGVPGARHARLQRRPRERAAGGADVSEERHVLVVANETVAGRSLIEAIERRAQGRTGAGHGDRAGQPAARGLRRLRGHAPRRGRAAARPDAHGAARRRGIPADGHRRRDRSGRRDPRRDRAARAPARRDRRLDPPAAAVGLAAPQRRRPDPRTRRAGCRSSTSSSTSSGRTAATRTCSWSRTRPSSASRCSRGSARGRSRGTSSFLIICPQSDLTAAAHPEAERRAAPRA